MIKKFPSKLFLLFSLSILLSATNINVANGAESQPIAYWDFNNASEISAGLIKDKSGTYTGQNLNGVPVSGYSGGALYFDLTKPLGGPGSGNGDGFTVGNIPELSQLTVTFRMKTDNFTNATQSVIIANNWNFNIQIKNNILGIGVPSGSLERTLMGDQDWHYYVVSYDGRNINLYVDGALKGFATAATTGKTVAGTWSFVSNGSITSQNNIVNKITIDELKIYDHVFNESEVSYEKDNNQLCSADIWSCADWTACSANKTQSRSCSITSDCPLVNTPSPDTTQSCFYVPPTCTSFTYSDWGTCSSDSKQTRSVSTSQPTGCANGDPVLSQACTYTPPTCTSNNWSCTDWATCSLIGQTTRTCNKVGNCDNGVPKPSITQSCTPTTQQAQTTPSQSSTSPSQPTCSEDIWSCGDWSSCSPNGIQTRNCQRTFDCTSAETAAPATSQYCQAPITQQQTTPQSNSDSGNSDALNSNQDSIIAATVKVICLVSKTSGKQGTGTIIDPKGIILTNKHVVEGTKGCVVGFINNADDDPLYDEVADIAKISGDEDIALLKIKNPSNKSFPALNISGGVINNKNLGNKLMIYGYPGIGGTKLTYSEGSVGGFGSAKEGLGNYIKTTAVIEHGNSGGGAYLVRDGSFIGIPSAGIKGELASIGYILSINKIKSWLSSPGLAYNGGFKNLSNDYVKAANILDNIDVGAINIFDVSTAKVSIYSNNTKKKVLPNNPGTIQASTAPTFQVTNVDSESGVTGYYFYFGTNIKTDPTAKGKLIKKSEYTPPTIRQPGVYYFIFRVKNKAGSISEPVITEYRYKK